MMEDRWKKVFSERACDIIDSNDLAPASLELLTSEMRLEPYVRKLSTAFKEENLPVADNRRNS